jgi:hypothetical protein
MKTPETPVFGKDAAGNFRCNWSHSQQSDPSTDDDNSNIGAYHLHNTSKYNLISAYILYYYMWLESSDDELLSVVAYPRSPWEALSPSPSPSSGVSDIESVTQLTPEIEEVIACASVYSSDMANVMLNPREMWSTSSSCAIQRYI